jgi:hypothetical protein
VVRLGEHDVDDVEHRRQALVGVLGPGKGHAGLRQAALGAGDPLRDRRLGQLVGVGDLCRGEARDGAQGQRHLPGPG